VSPTTPHLGVIYHTFGKTWYNLHANKTARQTCRPGDIFYLPQFLLFLTQAKLSQNLLDRFSRSFHQKKGICVSLISIRTSLFRFLKWRCHGNQFWAKFAKWPLFNTLAFRNGFEYRNSDLQALKSTIFATFCAILVKIGPLTPCRDYPGSFCTFWDETVKIDISYQISQQVLDRTSTTFQRW